MNEKTKKGVILLGYCIPYAFLGLYGDVTKGTVFFYIMMFGITGVLSAAAEANHVKKLAVAGNVISTVISYVCTLIFMTEKWSWYFKPFKATELILMISVLCFCGQYVVWSEMKRMRRRREAEG